jgi:hypothetical protein
MMTKPVASGSQSEPPSRHTLEAALHVGAIIDPSGSRVADTNHSYWHRATGGIHSPRDLVRAQELLLEVGLLSCIDDVLYPGSELTSLLTGSHDDALEALLSRCLLQRGAGLGDRELESIVEDQKRRSELLAGLGARFDDTHQRLVGDIGEEVVVDALRTELEWVGRADLAVRVRRVSLISDHLGYDVEAPSEMGAVRQIEVKATSSGAVEDEINIFLSRNEAETGLASPEWSLVVCHVTDIEKRTGEVLGWCSGADLAPHLPADLCHGRWQSVRVAVQRSSLLSGLP